MRDPTANIWRCTVQMRNGKFCDARSLLDMPFPICRAHSDELFFHMGGRPQFPVPSLSDIPSPEHLALIGDHLNEQKTWTQRRKQKLLDQTQVYYVRIHDHIKIGYSTNIKQRMVGLRVPIENVMATEPGGFDLEQERHAMFKAERIGRLEEFNPSRRLLAHIAAIKEQHGEPLITTYPNGAA